MSHSLAKTYIRKTNTISNKKLNIKERNSEIENFVGNYLKNKNNVGVENYMKKNFSYSKLISTKNRKYKTNSNSYKNIINASKSKINSTNNKNYSTQTNNNSFYTSKNHSIIKHESYKYFKVSPKIKPILSRVYFTSNPSFQNSQIINNDMTNNLKNIIKNTRINELDEDSPSTDRQTQTINKIENMSIHNMNYINIISNNNITEKDIIKNNKNMVFKKKRIPSCSKKSSSKPKESDNNILSMTKVENNSKLKNKNKKVDNLQFVETCSIYIKNSNKSNDNSNNNINNINYINETSKNFHEKKANKNKNNFNKSSIKNKTQININEMHKNFNLNQRNNYEKDYYTTNNYNNNHDNNINSNNLNNNSKENILDQTKMAFKELNLEDFLLIIQKFDDINNNLKYLYSFTTVNLNQNIFSTKKILEISHINKIKLYDLYRFYMGSSFDGCPEKLFSSKKTKYYLHCCSIIFILSIGILYVIFQKIKLIQECFQDITKLINIQEKIFLLFCDAMIQKLNKKYNQNIWVTKILDVLNNKLIFNVNNHINQIRTLTSDSYEIINNLLMSMNNFNISKNDNASKSQEKYLYNNFFNKNFKNFIEIEINQIEEEFNTNIFRNISLRNNYANLSSFKRSITVNNYKEMNGSNNNFYINNGGYSYGGNTKKIKKTNYINSSNYNTQNFTSNNISIINSNNNKIKNIDNSDRNKNRYLTNNTKSFFNTNQNNTEVLSSIQQYDIIIPDTEIIIPPITIPYLNFETTKKYTLVMDLDETMVNFKFINIKKGIGKIYIRPCLEIFLEVIKDYYEIISFTSATRDYADIVLDIIEKNKRKKYFEGRLYREHTTHFGNKYIKDLSKLGRDLSRVIIVDNLSQCFKLHTENGILISSFYGENENDRTLIELQKILIKIYYENCDVRTSINKYKDEIFNKISKTTLNYS